MNFYAEGATALLLAAALVAGGCALAPLRRTNNSLLSPGVWFALGAALFGTLSALVSLLPFASRTTAGLASGLLLVFAGSLKFWRVGVHRWRCPRLPRRILPALLLALCAVGASLHFSYAFIAPINYDVLSYHLPLASRFEEVLRGAQPIFYGEMPMLVPAIARFTMPAGGMGVGPAVLLACAVLAGASSTARIAARLGARRAGRYAAAALYLWHPIVLNATTSHLSDPWTALFAAAAAESMLAAISRSAKPGAWLMFGLFAGAAVATKLSAAGLVAIPLGLVLLVGGVQRIGAGATMRRLALGVLVSGAMLAPWVVRNMVVHGAPALTGWSPAQRAFVVNAHGPQTPLDASYWQTLAAKIGVPGYTIADALQPGILYAGDVAPRAASISFLLIAALATLTARRMRGAWGLLAAGALAMGALALLRDNPSRFYLAAIPWLAACGARFLFDATPARPLRLLLGMLLGVAVAGTAMAEFRLLPYRGWATDKSEFAHQVDELGRDYLRVVRASQSETGRGRTLVFFDGRNHLFGEATDLVTVWDPPAWMPSLRAATTEPNPASAFGAALQRMGYDRVMVNEFEYSRLMQFYDKSSGTNPKIGMEGFAEENTERTRRQLPHYPAHKIANMTEAEGATLVEFLTRCRGVAASRAQAGPVSEIWLAPIT